MAILFPSSPQQRRASFQSHKSEIKNMRRGNSSSFSTRFEFTPHTGKSNASANSKEHAAKGPSQSIVLLPECMFVRR